MYCSYKHTYICACIIRVKKIVSIKFVSAPQVIYVVKCLLLPVSFPFVDSNGKQVDILGETHFRRAEKTASIPSSYMHAPNS